MGRGSSSVKVLIPLVSVQMLVICIQLVRTVPNLPRVATGRVEYQTCWGLQLDRDIATSRPFLRRRGLIVHIITNPTVVGCPAACRSAMQDMYWVSRR